MNTGKPLRVAALGLEKTAVAALEIAFKGSRADWCRLTEEAEAEVVIMDGDRLGALTLFDEQRRRHPRRPVLVLSIREVQLKQAIVVRKPVKLEQLLAALREAQRLLAQPTAPGDGPSRPRASTPAFGVPAKTGPLAGSTASPTTRNAAEALQAEKLQEWCGQAEDFAFQRPPYPEEAFFEPDQYLLGNLLNAARLARDQQTAVQVETLYDPIILLPERRLAAVPIVERRLRALSLMPTRSRTFAALDQAEKRRRVAALSADCLMPLEALLWKVSLWSARGRLPQGTDPLAPVRLRHWPNLTRLPLLPHTLRIAAFWHQHPCSPVETARRLAIPQRYVFALYSACEALDLLQVDRSLTGDQRPPPERRGLLQRLLTVLKRAA